LKPNYGKQNEILKYLKTKISKITCLSTRVLNVFQSYEIITEKQIEGENNNSN